MTEENQRARNLLAQRATAVIEGAQGRVRMAESWAEAEVIIDALEERIAELELELDGWKAHPHYGPHDELADGACDECEKMNERGAGK